MEKLQNDLNIISIENDKLNRRLENGEKKKLMSNQSQLEF